MGPEAGEPIADQTFHAHVAERADAIIACRILVSLRATRRMSSWWCWPSASAVTTPGSWGMDKDVIHARLSAALCRIDGVMNYADARRRATLSQKADDAGALPR